VTARQLVLGNPDRPRGRLLGGFIALLGTTWFLSITLSSVAPDTALEGIFAGVLLPFLSFYFPGLLATVGGYLEYGAPTCLAVGLIPGIFWGTTTLLEGVVVGTTGETSALAIALAFATTSLFFAFGGYCVGAGVRYLRSV